LVNSPEVNPRGFRIGTAAVGATFCSPDAFRTTYAPSTWSFQNFVTGKDMIFVDPNAYVGIYEYPTAHKYTHKDGDKTPVDDDDEFLRSLDADQNNAQNNNSSSSKPAALKYDSVHSVDHLEEAFDFVDRKKSNLLSATFRPKRFILVAFASRALIDVCSIS
jgi:hypothetical protein